MKKITGLNNEVARTALEIILNDNIKMRMKNYPMDRIAFIGYLAGVQDTFMLLTESTKPFQYDDEVKDILKKYDIEINSNTHILK